MAVGYLFVWVLFLFICIYSTITPLLFKYNAGSTDSWGLRGASPKSGHGFGPWLVPGSEMPEFLAHFLCASSSIEKYEWPKWETKEGYRLFDWYDMIKKAHHISYLRLIDFILIYKNWCVYIDMIQKAHHISPKDEKRPPVPFHAPPRLQSQYNFGITCSMSSYLLYRQKRNSTVNCLANHFEEPPYYECGHPPQKTPKRRR